MPLPEDWRQLIESLNSNGVEYSDVTRHCFFPA